MVAPGISPRMGGVHAVTLVRLTWGGGGLRPLRIERSTDGLSYTTVARETRPRRLTELPVETSARYVAVVLDGWRPGHAELVDLAVFG